MNPKCETCSKYHDPAKGCSPEYHYSLKSNNHKGYYNGDLGPFQFIAAELTRLDVEIMNGQASPNEREARNFIQDRADSLLRALAEQVFKGELKITLRF